MYAKIALAAVVLSTFSTGALACGCKPPTATQKFHVNSGVGNGAEIRVGMNTTTEKKDLDPGRSGAHNRAFTNASKPQSPNASAVTIIP